MCLIILFSSFLVLFLRVFPSYDAVTAPWLLLISNRSEKKRQHSSTPSAKNFETEWKTNIKLTGEKESRGRSKLKKKKKMKRRKEGKKGMREFVPIFVHLNLSRNYRFQFHSQYSKNFINHGNTARIKYIKGNYLLNKYFTLVTAEHRSTERMATR